MSDGKYISDWVGLICAIGECNSIYSACSVVQIIVLWKPIISKSLKSYLIGI